MSFALNLKDRGIEYISVDPNNCPGLPVEDVREDVHEAVRGPDAGEGGQEPDGDHQHHRHRAGQPHPAYEAPPEERHGEHAEGPEAGARHAPPDL